MKRSNWMALRREKERTGGTPGNLGTLRRIAVFEGTSKGKSKSKVMPQRPFARPFRGTETQHRQHASDVSVEARAALRDVQRSTARGACGEAIYDLVRASSYVGSALSETLQAGSPPPESTKGLDRELNEAMSEVVRACVKPKAGMFSGKRRK